MGGTLIGVALPAFDVPAVIQLLTRYERDSSLRLSPHCVSALPENVTQ